MIPTFKSPILSQLKGIQHAFTTREGGVSTGYLTSLNSSYKKDDAPENVDENRRRICASVNGQASELHTVYQEHTTIVWTIKSKDQPPAHEQVADALVTNLTNTIIGISTADCVPVLFADPVNGVIGAAHAGWRGAVGGILDNTVQAMISLGADCDHITAAIGPCIWQFSYEVGDDFRQHFKGADAYFIPGQRDHHWQFDLPGYVQNRLLSLGIKQVSPSPADTFSNPDRFFSFRRKTLNNEPTFGISLSVIKLEEVS